jgi:hypothetical protein
MFLPLAVNAELARSSSVHRVLNTTLLAAFGTGWVALAVNVLSR